MGRKKLNQDQLHKTKLIMKGNPQLHFKNETVVDFKVPKGNPAYLKVLNKPAFPVFSNDAKFYTPSFILSKIEGLKDEDCQNLHKQKVEQSLKEIESGQIMMPKPSNKSLFCGVCRKCYEDYLEHVMSPDHTKLLSQSKYQKQIRELCYYFQNCLKKPHQTQTIKKNSADNKTPNQDQSCTQCFIEQKKIFA